MEEKSKLGLDTLRKESWDKVTGGVKYNGDIYSPDTLHVKILTSTFSHALIKKIDIEKASRSKGVQKIITGDYLATLTGSSISDRPPIAKDKVRYYGEPLALIVANSEQEAMRAAKLISVDYEALPIVGSIEDAIKPNAVLVHEDLTSYYCTDKTIRPRPNSNIIDLVRIRKGDMQKGWSESDLVLEESFSLPQSDHLAMETRNVRAQINADNKVLIYSSSQAPFAIKEELSQVFAIPESDIIVNVPLVGGAFGGKATVSLEFLAYLASRAVGGKMVRSNTREEDISSFPSKIGAEISLKIGATQLGEIKAIEVICHVNCGAYADTGPRMAKAIASDISGPYNIENVYCDSFSVYTNHVYVTSYRGFGHSVSSFAMERMLDKLAIALNIDPLDLRSKNAISEGDTSATQAKITLSNTGSLPACIIKLKELIKWDEGNVIRMKNGMIRARGVSCFWKTSNSPINATSGVIITVNSDGSINLNFGAVEFGPGMKTTIAQIVAEKLKMDVEKVSVFMGVDTQLSPKHWKTVASMTTLMVGNAAIKAADDLMHQLKALASVVLKCIPEDLDIANQRVYLKSDPSMYIEFKNIMQGYEYPGGQSISGYMVGRGNYIVKHLVPLDKITGKGKTGVSWTVGAQGVLIEYDPRSYTYRLIEAATVIDAGKVINPKSARGVIMGGMSMGLGLATREEFLYDVKSELKNTSLRTYKLLRLGEQPRYSVEFVETPQIDAPFGARGLGEQGILGISAAFANAISAASGVNFNRLPISPELIWKTITGGKYDTL